MFASRFDPSKANPKESADKKARLLNKLEKKTKEEKMESEKVSSIAVTQNQDEDSEMKLDDVDDEDDDKMEEIEQAKGESALKRKREDSDSESESEPESEEKNEEIDSEVSNAHSGILSRFKSVMEKQPEIDDENSNQESSPIDYKDVAPLPQLKLPKDKKLYSQSYKNKNIDWISEPAYYDSSVTKPFKEFQPKINSTILKNLKEEFKIENAFSVQVTLIQELLKDIIRGRFDPKPRGDYLVNASTGSGKTLSYLIPIVQYILGSSTDRRITDSGVKCIIIVPTKPLVQQVYSDTLNLTKGTDVNVMALKSGGNISINDEKKRIDSNLIDVLITTPGRLVEHLDNLKLNSLRFLIVDEADRLLNQNFQDWCDLVMNKIEKNNFTNNSGMEFTFKLRCIKIVLSATLTTNSEKLTHLRLFRPRLVIVNSDNSSELYQLPRLLDEKYMRVPEGLSYFKPLILLRFFHWSDKNGNLYDNHGIIFTKSNESTIRLNKLLNLLIADFGLANKLKINCINSMMDNQERSKILKKFDEDGGILICTDLLSRGINLTSIKFVINYDLPSSTKEYIHRIGRTARAGNMGNAISLCYGENEFKWFKKVVYSGQQINRNGKNIVDVKFVKEHKDDQLAEREDVDIFQLNLTDNEKEVYEKCLKQL